MITVSFNLRKEDVVALSCHYYAESASLRAARTRGQISIVIVLLSVSILLFTLQERIGMAAAVPALCAPVVAFMYPRYYRQKLRQAAEMFVSESSYERSFGKYTITMSDEGLHSTTPVSESRYAWAAVRRVAMTPEYLFIFLTGPHGWPISKSQVPEERLQELQTFAEARIENSESAGEDNR